MPKEIPVDPHSLRTAGRMTFKDIPVHAYRDTARRRARDAGRRGADRQFSAHMMIVREFETHARRASRRRAPMPGSRIAYKGPAHLSIGQEGAAVGAALALEPADHIFGSHRSHGEFIAKGLSAIDRLPRRQLVRDHGGPSRRRAAAHGRDARSARERRDGPGRELPALRPARRDLHARQRLQRRHGRLMHAFFPPFGAYPEQRHRRRLGRHRGRRGARARRSAAAAASRSPTSATARPAAARSGRR